MRTSRLQILLFVLPFTTSIAFGQTQRTFVSAHGGSDTNPCSAAQPCRNFSAAMAQTLAGGEIIVLDSAGYGPVTVDKSVSIVSPAGVFAGVTAFSGNAITINTASLTVVLAGLTLNGLGGANGIGQNGAGGTLYVKRCLITGFTNTGIGISIPAGGVRLFMAETDIRSSGTYGVYAFSGTPANPHRISVDHARVEKNSFGVYLDTFSLLDAYECVFAANTSSGVIAQGGGTEANLDRCLITHNVNGVSVAHGVVRVSNCTITDNTTKGIDDFGDGSILSRLNNTAEGNSADDAAGMYTAK